MDLLESTAARGAKKTAAWAAVGALGTWLGGVGLGAGLMYLLDPRSGRRRRALMRDKAVHGVRTSKDLMRKATVDLQHRAEGIAAEMRSRMDPHPVSDEVLVERIRSAMGRLVSHPGAIHVRAVNGRVTVSGPILTDEARALLRLLARMHEVRGVEDRLERHATADRIPGLQGGQTRGSHRAELLQESWAPSIRVLAGAAGAGMTLWGMRQRGLIGGTASGAGATLLLRAATNLPLRRLFGFGAGRRAVEIQKHVHIAAPVEEVFEFLADLGNFPRWMEHVRNVTVRHGGRSHWVVAGPGGMPVAFDAEQTAFRENEMLAWRSVEGAAVQSAGIVRVESDGERGTLVEIRMSYNPPGGAIGHAIASLLRVDPKHALDDDMLRLKSLLEIGKTRAHGERITRDELGHGR